MSAVIELRRIRVRHPRPPWDSLCRLTGFSWHLPATPTEVRDVCDAGDTVFSALAVGLVTRNSLKKLGGGNGEGGKAGGGGGSGSGRVNAKANLDAVLPASDPPFTGGMFAFCP